MQIHIIVVDSTTLEFAKKLETLIERKGIDVTLKQDPDAKHSAGDYERMAKEGARFIFLGSNVPNISKWEYVLFGCYIGWIRKECVILAWDSEVGRKNYNGFQEYCTDLHVDGKHPDVIIPPENFFDGVKKAIGADTIRQAQYSTLIYEFMNNHLDEFINAVDRPTEAEEGQAWFLKYLKALLRKLKSTPQVKLTLKQKALCHGVIDGTALLCGGIAFIPIPVADAIPITGAQVTMVCGLGKIFNHKITRADAKSLLKVLAAPLIGRAAAKNALILVPIGWAINAAVAAVITEILGWSVAYDFAAKKV